MKLVFVGNRFPPNVVGGAELSMYYLISGLKSEGVDVAVLTLADGLRGGCYDFEGIPVRAVPNLNIYNQFDKTDRSFFKKIIFACLDIFNPLYFLYFIFLLAKIKPDFLCSHNLKGMGLSVWFAARLLGIKIVHTSHDYWIICAKSTMFSAGQNCKKRCASCKALSFPKIFASNLASYHCSVSSFVKRKHEELRAFRMAKKVVIHNARPLFFGSTVARIEPGKFKVGFIGRIDSTKGLDYLFSAIDKFFDVNVELHVAGNNPFGILEKLRSQFPNVNVVYHGFVAPNVFYPELNVVVVPSLWNEPFGNVAFESWEFGVPSVVFENGGLPEVLHTLPELIVRDVSSDSLFEVLNRLRNDRHFYDECAERVLSGRSYFLPERQLAEFKKMLCLC